MKPKIYDKRDDFDFDIVNFPFLDGDVPRTASYGVYISQLIRFARVSSHGDDFNTRNNVLTAKLLRQGYRYHKLRMAFSKFYRRHFDIVSKYNVGLKTLLLQGLSEPEFYGDLVYKFRKIIGKNDFPYHFKKIIVRYEKIGYNINVIRQTTCLVVNPMKVNSPSYSCISELSCLCCVEILKNLPVHLFKAFIIPVLRDCLPNYLLVFLSFEVYLILC